MVIEMTDTLNVIDTLRHQYKTSWVTRIRVKSELTISATRYSMRWM